jgi:hypothetical protein
VVTNVSDDGDESSVEIPVTIEVGGCAGVAGGDIGGAGGRGAQSACLRPNRPNPFRSQTTIVFDLAERSAVSLAVYDVKGEMVGVVMDDHILPAGTHSVPFAPGDFGRSDLPAGIYYCRLVAGGSAFARAMVVLGNP